MNRMKGMEIVDDDGSRILLPFDKVLKMERPGAPDKGKPILWIKLFDPMGVSIKIKDLTEIDRVWCEFQAWLTGPVGTPLS